MLQYILRRLVLLVPVLFGVSIVIFGLIRMIPGDAAMLAIGVDQRITEEQREAVRRSYGLDQPLPVQYVRWMGHVLQGDLGQSLRTRRPITDELRLRMPVTIQLALMAGILGNRDGRDRGRETQFAGRLPRHGRDVARNIRAQLPDRDPLDLALFLQTEMVTTGRVQGVHGRPCPESPEHDPARHQPQPAVGRGDDAEHPLGRAGSA